MENLFDNQTHNKVLERIEQLTEQSQSQWGIMQYKHLDHHLKQFGV